jgi:8-oxo-dGTP pyrophosphatase MutT (NUDIX family)
MKQGAGIIIRCKNSGNLLFGLRTDRTPKWSFFGGTLEKDEDPIKCAKRELMEEAGFIEGSDYHLLSDEPIHIVERKYFRYYCYMAESEYEKVPTINYEHSDFKWDKLDNIKKSDLHFGIKDMLKNQAAVDIVKGK